MKSRISNFRLSTFMLVVACLALAIGWYAERQAVQEEHLKELDSSYSAAYRLRGAWETVLTAKAYRDASSDQFEYRTKHQLFLAMGDLWRFEQKIDRFSIDGTSPSAVELGKDILEILKCANAECYFEFAKKLLSDEESESLYPEIFDRDSSDFDGLMDFVKRAAETNE